MTCVSAEGGELSAGMPQLCQRNFVRLRHGKKIMEPSIRRDEEPLSCNLGLQDLECDGGTPEAVVS